MNNARISKYFAEVYQCPWSHIEPILPVTMACWGKVCIANGGDKIWSSSTVSEVQAETSHDSSFVWVSASTDIQLRLQWFRILYSMSCLSETNITVTKAKNSSKCSTDSLNMFLNFSSCTLKTLKSRGNSTTYWDLSSPVSQMARTWPGSSPCTPGCQRQFSLTSEQ